MGPKRHLFKENNFPSRQPYKDHKDKIIIVLTITLLSLALFIYSAIVYPLSRNFFVLPFVPGGLNSTVTFMMVFSIFHASYTLGWRHALVFFGMSIIIAWLYEQVGVQTGAIYGPYHYTAKLGAKIGNVPIVILIAWFMMAYPSFIIGNLIMRKRICCIPRGNRIQKNNSAITILYNRTKRNSKLSRNFGRIICLSITSAIVMTMWDVVVDPYLSGPTQRAWIWENAAQNPYFGIPFQNFAGWILTTFSIYIAYCIFETKIHSRPVGNLTKLIILMPLIAYGAQIISDIIPREPPILLLIGPVVMSIPIGIASYSLWTLGTTISIRSTET
jgi:putative membrane protein